MHHKILHSFSDETAESDIGVYSEDILPSSSHHHNVRPVSNVIASSNLDSCRTRIDASINEQRKYRQILAGLNNKVMKYRQRIANSVAQLNIPHVSDLATDAKTIHMLTCISKLLHTKPDGLSTNLLLSSSLCDVDRKTDFHDSSIDFIIQQLRDEQLRNDDLEDLNYAFREKVEVAIRLNQNLKEDLLKTQEELKRLLRERELERFFLNQNDEKNKRTMDMQQQQMLELWVAFNRLRRQIRDLKTETESDLNRQQTEFVRCANNIEAVVRQAEMKRKNTQLVETKGDAAMDDLLKKYEDMAVCNIKLEHKLSDSNRRVALMEVFAKKAIEERDAANNVLKKIQQMSELDEVRGRRARSVSSDGFLDYFNTIRLVRAALQNKNTEINEYKRKCNEFRVQLSECESRLSHVEKLRRKSDEDLFELKKENDKIGREKEEIEQKFRHLNEKFEQLNAEKSKTNLAIQQLQYQIKSFNMSNQKTLNELLTKQCVGIVELRERSGDELDGQDTNYSNGLSNLSCEHEKSRNEVGQSKDQTSTDCMTGRRRIDDKENTILEHQLAAQNLHNRDMRDVNSSKDIRITELHEQIEELEVDAERLRNKKPVLENEKASLMVNTSSLGFENTMEQSELIREDAAIKIFDVTKQDRFQKNLLLEKTVADYVLRIDSGNEQIRAMKVEQTIEREEIGQNVGRFMAMNQKKSKISNEHSNPQDELERMSSANLEKMVADFERNLASHISEEAVLCDILEQHKVKDRQTLQVVAKTEAIIARLNEVFVRTKSEHGIELQRFQHEYREMEKKAVNEKEIELRKCDDTIYPLCKNEAVLEKSLALFEQQLKELLFCYEKTTLEKESLCARLSEGIGRSTKRNAFLRQQLDSVKERYIAEAANWEKERAEKERLYNLKVMEMKEQMKVLQNELRESREIEASLRRHMMDLNLLIGHERAAVKMFHSEISKKDKQTKSEVEKFDQERQKWAKELNLKNEELTVAHYDIDNAQRKCLDLEKTLYFVEAYFNEKAQNLIEIENELKEIKSHIASRMDEEAALKSRLMEDENEKNNLRMELENLKVALEKACIEAEKNKDDKNILCNELMILRSKLQDEEKKTQKLSTNLKHLENKSEESKTAITSLQIENEKLSRKLVYVRNVLKQKTAVMQRALSDMMKNYQTAEKARIDALRTKETISVDLDNLKSRLEILDGKRADLEQKLAKFELIRKCLIKIVSQFQSSARKALSFAEKEIVELCLLTSWQFSVSQKGSRRTLDNERRIRKNRVMGGNFHICDNEERFISLNEQLTTLKTELAAAENEHEKFINSEAIWSEERLLFESAYKEANKNKEHYWMEMKLLNSSKEELGRSLFEMEQLLIKSQQQCAELGKENRENRKMLGQNEIRRNLEKSGRKEVELKKLDSLNSLTKLNALQHGYDNCLFRLRASGTEIQSLKNDLDETRKWQVQIFNRKADMQHKMEELFFENIRLREHMKIMGKQERDNQKLEKEIISELEQIRADKIMLVAENEELKLRLKQTEMEHREFVAHRTRLEGERSALKRNIKTLEAEKQRRDVALRQIIAERQTFDKSLKAMEKENLELYRKCTQLQNQCKIVSLEDQLDSGRKRRLNIVERTILAGRNPREIRFYQQIGWKGTIDKKN